ncbi:1-deoxy-D-xylulose-5-phosphate synthase [bioreactor metagenome]|uniref:1-deoxy-D-xylulose-5-phosphate synthase n=1 Tax=bioreactor metagenome TaxID=1076179 RepID=A0A645HFS1_9ZZZZ
MTYGRIFSFACQAFLKLRENGIHIKILKINRIKPLDRRIISEVSYCKNVFFFEEGIKSGGVAEKLGNMLLENGYKGTYKITAVEDEFVEQASVNRQLERYKLDCDGIVKEVTQALGR